MGTDPCGVNGLGDKSVDKFKLRPGDVHIHAAQNIDPLCNRLPAEGNIFRNIQIQIPIQGLQCLLGTSVGVSGIEFPVGAAVIDVQISIAVQRYQFDLPRIFINTADDIHIRLNPGAYIGAAAVHSEYGDHAVALLHLFSVFHGEFIILYILRLKLFPLHHIPPSCQISVPEDQHQGKTLNHDHGYDPPFPFLVFCPGNPGLSQSLSGVLSESQIRRHLSGP